MRRKNAATLRQKAARFVKRKKHSAQLRALAAPPREACWWVVQGADLESRPPVGGAAGAPRGASRGQWVRQRDLQVGDLLRGDSERCYVLAAPPGDGDRLMLRAFRWCKVEQLYRGGVKPLMRVYYGNEMIRVTHEHPWYVQNRGWVASARLQPGDLLMASTGDWVAVERIEDLGEQGEVFNLRVADCHTYFVGGSNGGPAVLVHNQSAPAAGGGLVVDGIRVDASSALYKGYAPGSTQREVLDKMIASKQVYNYTAEELRFELKLRVNVMKAAQEFAALDRGFAGTGGSGNVTSSTYWQNPEAEGEVNKGRIDYRGNAGGYAAALRDLFSRTTTLACECNIAVQIILYKGLLDTVGDDEFNRIVGSINTGGIHYGFFFAADSTPFVSKFQTLGGGEPDTIPKRDLLPGDYTAITNPDTTDHDFRGENVIMLPGGGVFAHPFGLTTLGAVMAKMKEDVPAGGRAPSMNPVIVFFDVQQLLSIMNSQKNKK